MSSNQRVFRLIVFPILIVLLSTAIQADNDLWFWAWRSYDLEVDKPEDQRGDLIAFTEDGEVNVLLENVFPVVLQRIDENTAFVSGEIDSIYRLYYLTSSQATEVLELFDQSYIDESFQFAIYAGYSYFTPQIIPTGENRFLIRDTKRNQYLIYDASTDDGQSINLHPWCNDDCVRISNDGRYIRYRVSQTQSFEALSYSDLGENQLPYQLYEYDSVTQDERMFFEQQKITLNEGEDQLTSGDCTPDQFGDRWYCELFIYDDGNPNWIADEKYIVHANGDVETVNPTWKLRVVNDRWYFLDVDRAHDCDICFVNVFPDGDETKALHFEMPSQEDFPFWYDEIDILSEQNLIMNPNGMPMNALSRSGELTELGARPCCADPISQDYYDEKTGWMIVINISDLDTAQTEIWSTRPLSKLASFPIDTQPGVGNTFRDYSLALSDVVYSYFDEVIYELDFTEPRAFIEAFPGGLLLYDYGNKYVNSDSPFVIQNDGIYRWTPSEGETLLIDGASVIQRDW